MRYYQTNHCVNIQACVRQTYRNNNTTARANGRVFDFSRRVNNSRGGKYNAYIR